MSDNAITVILPPGKSIATLPGWDELPRKTQLFLEKEDKLLQESRSEVAKSRISDAERLLGIKQEMPRGTFTPYLVLRRYKRATVMKELQAYENARTQFPNELYLARAGFLGFPMLGHKEDAPLGIYTRAAKLCPPPPNTRDIVKIDKHLYMLESKRLEIDGRSKSGKLLKSMESIEKDPDELARGCYRTIINTIKKLPTTGEARRDKRMQRAFAENVFGMVFATLGMSSPVAVEPQAAPEGYNAVVGRPPKQEDDEDAA